MVDLLTNFDTCDPLEPGPPPGPPGTSADSSLTAPGSLSPDPLASICGAKVGGIRTFFIVTVSDKVGIFIRTIGCSLIVISLSSWLLSSESVSFTLLKTSLMCMGLLRGFSIDATVSNELKLPLVVSASSLDPSVCGLAELVIPSSPGPSS